MSAECSIIERCKIVKIVQNCSNCSKLVLNFQIRVYSFGLWGWAGFLSGDWFIAWSDSQNGSTSWSTLNHHTSPSPSTINWPHRPVCTSRVFPEWESCVFIISLLPVPWVCPLCQLVYQMCQRCASMPEGHPWSDCASLDSSRCPRCPEGLDIVPLCQMAVQDPQDCTYGLDCL